MASMKVAQGILNLSATYRLWQAPFAAAKLAPFLARNDLQRARRVLDVGCGPGTNALFAHADYLGVDITPDYIAYARKKFRRPFVVADVSTYEVRRTSASTSSCSRGSVTISRPRLCGASRRTCAHFSARWSHPYPRPRFAEAPFNRPAARPTRPRRLPPTRRRMASAVWRTFEACRFRAQSAEGVGCNVVDHGLLQRPGRVMKAEFRLPVGIPIRNEATALPELADIRFPLDAGDFGLMSRRVVGQRQRRLQHHRCPADPTTLAPIRVGMGTVFQNPHDRRPDHGVYANELRLTDLAELLGFDPVWGVEHHFTDYTMCPDVLQFLTWVAGRTERVSIGSMVVVLPWHDPLRVAEQVSMLDHMSQGRFIFGIGRGLGRVEFNGFRAPMEESRGRFVESAEMILRGLEDGYCVYDGEFVKQPRTPI